MRRTDANGNTTRYAYDAYGNRASMTYPDGKTVKYSYDELNRLVKLSGLSETVRYDYNAKGQRTETRTDKLTTEYAYDVAGNLVSQSTTGAYDLAFEYDYDKAGRITQESRTENGATITSEYAYDKLGQLTGFERSDGYSESYVYDPVGNMLSKTRNGVKTDYTYNAANQLVSDGENNYTYDKNGNLVQKGDTRYTYNAQNLLESWTDGEQSESYSYNANRLLSSVTNAEGTTSFVWDILTGDGVVISSESGSDTTDYLYGLERIAALNGKNKTEYAYDGRGSVAAELRYTDAWYTLGGALSKADVTSKSYTPFGEQIGEALSGFGYNGEYYNANTGMIYLRARFYEPEMNRFSQKDIVRGSTANTLTQNRYLYCYNDPVDYVDPSGQIGLLGGTLIAAGISGLISGGVSAYRSYKATGKVDWKQAGKAALGGATAAVAVGVAVATGGTGLGVATMAFEAVAGGKTAFRGGNAAAVTTSMAKAGTAAVIAGNVLPALPNTIKAAIGTVGTVAGSVQTAKDVESASNTFKNPTSTLGNKVNAIAKVTSDVAATVGSALYAYSGVRGIIADWRAASATKQHITESPVVESPANGEYICSTSNDVISTTNSTLSPEQVMQYAMDAAKGNAESNKVVLGKYIKGSESSYDAVAKSMDAQYFNLDNWNELSAQYSRDEIWKINEQFLKNAVNSGKEIYLSHNPADFAGNGSYLSSEIQTLVDMGYSFVKEGGIWHAIR